MKHVLRLTSKTFWVISVCLLIIMPLHAKDDFTKPKELGVYVKTDKGLKRLVPNIVFNEKGVLFVEPNNPSHFLLKDIQFFVIHGKYDTKVLTLNPLLFFQPSPLGKQRYIFGKDIAFDLKKKSDDLYVVKPKELLGRGYIALWINDSAWDFIIE
ncbi:MAG: hypothetical protein WBJ54_07155 [Syntrophorhabdus sp.]|jgi:hypothetical protein|nr:hypothetical protein [Syntrophorhabdus sp.]MDI9557679.1 hypothetical protein [Pseudomonadota bacterium]OPX93842.1 MAG: hypothetical protein A4E59_02462 [Syntrophorhabdus sp. PtaB.Bin027]OQB77908.1 MAG: hypothetical protein BWX92_00549 [Deltaproteobacteria bacterium ADurb.Bin135]MBP8744401.1 hypothetical protein [Syntrophorhabdus sp.]